MTDQLARAIPPKDDGHRVRPFWIDYLGYLVILSLFFGVAFLGPGWKTLKLVWLPHAITTAQVAAVTPRNIKDCSSEDWCSVITYKFHLDDHEFTGTEEVVTWDISANPTIQVTYNLADASINSPYPDQGGVLWLLILLVFLVVPLLAKVRGFRYPT